MFNEALSYSQNLISFDNPFFSHYFSQLYAKDNNCVSVVTVQQTTYTLQIASEGSLKFLFVFVLQKYDDSLCRVSAMLCIKNRKFKTPNP